GIGTAARALASGTPQLVLPFGYDRPDNGTRIRRLGVGDCLPPSRWQPSTIADSLRQLMESPAVRERCTDFRHRMNSERSSARACDVIELALQYGRRGNVSSSVGTMLLLIPLRTVTAVCSNCDAHQRQK